MDIHKWDCEDCAENVAEILEELQQARHQLAVINRLSRPPLVGEGG